MNKLFEIFSTFLELGLIAFGGPAAHMALFHKKIVDEKKWMDENHYLDLIAATALIPGPNSTEMAIHCGYHRGGIGGLFLSGVGFILPASLITGFACWLYLKGSHLPNLNDYLFGVRVIVVVIIFQAFLKLRSKAIKSPSKWLTSGLALLFSLLSFGEIFSLILSTLVGLILLEPIKNKFQAELGSFFLIFLKIGSVLFGSGYVLIAYLQDELVFKRSLLTLEQLSDAIAIGQFTPGPVLSTATFIGGLIHGFWGALLATIGIFLPSFIFVLILNPLIPKMRSIPWISKSLDHLNAASLGLIAYACWILGRSFLFQWQGLLLLTLGLITIFYFKKINTMLLVLGASLIGKCLLYFA